MDWGKERLRLETEAGFQWLEYKAVRLQSICYHSAEHNNQPLIDWVNSQNIVNRLVCLGDGHDGVDIFT